MTFACVCGERDTHVHIKSSLSVLLYHRGRGHRDQKHPNTAVTSSPTSACSGQMNSGRFLKSERSGFKVLLGGGVAAAHSANPFSETLFDCS
jgi:hypothetical protein